MSVNYKRTDGLSFRGPPRIVCFICAAEVPADYPLYVEPQHGTMSSPHFPFLISHTPPHGCLPMDVTKGEAKSCRPCYTSLMRQWEEYEQARVPPIKRSYWIKRVDGVPFSSPELQQRIAIQIQAKYGGVSVVATTADGLMIAPLPPTSESPMQLTADRLKLNSNVPAAHALSLKRPPGPDDPSGSSGGGDNDSALDLSVAPLRDRETMRSRSSATSHISAVSHHSSYQSEGAGSSTDILDLTLPDKNASTEVCYVCGDEFKKGALSFTFAKQLNKEPFYPSLLCHSRPPKSRPIDSSGRVQTCDDCHNHLLQQWFHFEATEVPHADRNYTLRKRQTMVLDNATFVCYICALEYQSSSLRLIYSRPNSEQEPFDPFIEQHKPPPGASPISPQGMVQVCTQCYKAAEKRSTRSQPPPKKRRFDANSDYHNHDNDDDKGLMPADVTCILCRRKFSIGFFKFLHSRGPPMGGLPYFPFLADLTRPDELFDAEEDKQGRMRACQDCTTSLINQWTAFQREGVAIDSRKYTYPSLVTGPRSVSSVRAQSPASQVSGGTVTPGSKSLPMQPTTTAASGNTETNPQSTRARSNTLESANRSASNPHSPNPPPPIPSPASTATANSNPQRPTPASSAAPSTVLPSCNSPSFPSNSSANASNNILQPGEGTTGGKPATTSSFYCFLCGLHSELSFARMLYSTPQGKKAPYFPFMKKHVPKNKAETLREDGTALVCTFCYHSVMDQWVKYNDDKVVTDPKNRKYNTCNYICYVCSVMTYRKRIRALRVVDFPFLRVHKTKKAVITLENGEMVAVCLDCYERLREQFQDGERCGIPVEQRQYNWMRIPPPPEESSSHITTPQERLVKAQSNN